MLLAACAVSVSTAFAQDKCKDACKAFGPEDGKLSTELSFNPFDQNGNTFELEGALTTVGRDPANSIFLNDMTVSRSHAKIKHDASGVSIEDLGSLNGTWVDGAIVSNAPLHDGSSIQIGTFTLIYHESQPERIETGE